MTESARIIIIKKCEDCPYCEAVKKFNHCFLGFFNLSDISRLHENCPLEEIELELEEDSDEGI